MNDKMFTCPRCGIADVQYSRRALSRLTRGGGAAAEWVCPDCGTEEAWEEYAYGYANDWRPYRKDR